MTIVSHPIWNMLHVLAYRLIQKRSMTKRKDQVLKTNQFSKGLRCGCVVRPVKGISKMFGGSLMLNESYTHRNSAQALL